MYYGQGQANNLRCAEARKVHPDWDTCPAAWTLRSAPSEPCPDWRNRDEGSGAYIPVLGRMDCLIFSVAGDFLTLKTVRVKQIS